MFKSYVREIKRLELKLSRKSSAAGQREEGKYAVNAIRKVKRTVDIQITTNATLEW